MSDTPPQIFDPHLRALHRDRAHARFAAHDFLHRRMSEEVIDRLTDVKRPFGEALVVGAPDAWIADQLRALGQRVLSCDPGFLNARAAGGIQGDEDALPFADASFDLIVAVGTLDSVNDLPGALVLMNRILRPDGLMLAAFYGAGTLPRLRAALQAAEGDRPGQHVHPMIDLRAAGDLLSRAGFRMPVADGETVQVRYGSLFGLMEDLRGMGAANALASHPPALTRTGLVEAVAHFAASGDPDGKTAEQFAIIHLSGWKADPSQAGPARRGSGKISLAEALKPKAN